MKTQRTDQDLKEQAGYIKHRTFEPSGSRIVVYRASEQGIDIGERYAVVCELHGMISGVSSKRQALADMRHPIDFCAECMESVCEDLCAEGLLERVEPDDHDQHCEVCGEPIERVTSVEHAPGKHVTVTLTPENWAHAVRPYLADDDMRFVALIAVRHTEKFGARVRALAPDLISGPDLAALMLRVANGIDKEGQPS